MPKRKELIKIVKGVLPAAVASQGIPLDPEAQLELMRHRLIHQLPKSRLGQLLKR